MATSCCQIETVSIDYGGNKHMGVSKYNLKGLLPIVKAIEADLRALSTK